MDGRVRRRNSLPVAVSKKLAWNKCKASLPIFVPNWKKKSFYYGRWFTKVTNIMWTNISPRVWNIIYWQYHGKY